MARQTQKQTDAKRDRVLQAAAETFFRYGYARATIGDIAREAQIHRPALYQIFPGGKDELFEGVLLRLVEKEVTRYRAEVERYPTLRERLLFCVEEWSMGGFRLMDQHPDAKDAFNIRYPAVRKMYDVLISFYSELINEAAKRCPLGIEAEQLARILVFSLRGTRDLADGAESLRLITTQQVDLFLSGLNATGQAESGLASKRGKLRVLSGG